MDLNNISISSDKDKIKNFSKSKVIQTNKSINTQSANTNSKTEIQNQNDNSNNNNLSIYNFINEIPFENLNDYYDIESNLFIKRIEKLNLKFYWTSECVLNQQDIKYPYNKLFLILFKQISLYIEEIARLNKQLKQKIKNEKSFQMKIAKMKQKENENVLNKQMLKNLQRDNKLLEKKNEKNKNEIEKLNKKLENSYKTMIGNKTSVNEFNRNNVKDKNYNYISPKFSNTSMVYDDIITQESVLSKRSDLSAENKKKYIINVSVKNKNKSVSTSVDKNYNKNNNKETINHGIMLCDEEIENLELMEEILKNFKNKNLNNKIIKDKSNSLNKINKANNNSNNSIKNNAKKSRGYNNKINFPFKKNYNKFFKSDEFLKKTLKTLFSPGMASPLRLHLTPLFANEFAPVASPASPFYELARQKRKTKKNVPLMGRSKD